MILTALQYQSFGKFLGAGSLVASLGNKFYESEQTHIPKVRWATYVYCNSLGPEVAGLPWPIEGCCQL